MWRHRAAREHVCATRPLARRSKLLGNEDGQTFVEYVLILGLVVIAGVVLLTGLHLGVRYSQISSELASIVP